NGVFRVPSFEEALKKRFSPKSLEGMSISADGMNSDIHGSAEYRAHLVGVLARRAVADAIGKPIAGSKNTNLPSAVPGLAPGICVFTCQADVDCQDKPGSAGLD